MGEIPPTNSRELAPDVKDHDNRHNECHDVHGARGTLEDDCIRKFNIPSIAVRLDANIARNFGDGTYRSTERDRRRLAEASKVPKTARHIVQRFRAFVVNLDGGL
jgi:hypothetical protein